MNLAHLLLRVRGVGAITDPEVASALRLSESQVVRIKDVQRANSASLKGRIRALFGRGFSEASSSSEGAAGESISLRTSLRELQEETERRALCVLNDEQKKKLAKLQGQA